MSVWQGRALISGSCSGPSLVLDGPLSLWGGLDPRSGEIIDRRHPQSGELVTGRVLVMPRGRGSSSASSVLLEAVRLETAPLGLVLAFPDGILVLGAAVADELYERTVPVAVLEPDDHAELSRVGVGRVVAVVDGDVQVR